MVLIINFVMMDIVIIKNFGIIKFVGFVLFVLFSFIVNNSVGWVGIMKFIFNVCIIVIK